MSDFEDEIQHGRCEACGSSAHTIERHIAEVAICTTCRAQITRSASEWFHVDDSEWDQRMCCRGGPPAVPVADSVRSVRIGGDGT